MVAGDVDHRKTIAFEDVAIVPRPGVEPAVGPLDKTPDEVRPAEALVRPPLAAIVCSMYRSIRSRAGIDVAVRCLYQRIGMTDSCEDRCFDPRGPSIVRLEHGIVSSICAGIDVTIRCIQERIDCICDKTMSGQIRGDVPRDPAVDGLEHISIGVGPGIDVPVRGRDHTLNRLRPCEVRGADPSGPAIVRFEHISIGVGPGIDVPIRGRE